MDTGSFGQSGHREGLVEGEVCVNGLAGLLFTAATFTSPPSCQNTVYFHMEDIVLYGTLIVFADNLFIPAT